jgi:hypothetical protein
MKRAEVARYWEANAETWTRHVRAGYDIYRDGLNTPAFLDMLPPVRGLRASILVVASDRTHVSSRGLVRRCMPSMSRRPSSGRTRHGDSRAAWCHLHSRRRDRFAVRCRFVRFRGSLHVNDGHGRPGPRFLRGSTGPATGRLSPILDPASVFCTAASPLLREPDGTTRAIEIAGYFDATDGRVDTWWLTNVPQEERKRTERFRVPRFHRTLSGWVDLILEAGLVIERFNEPSVSVELAKAEPVLEDTRVAPPFLHIRVIKPAAPPANGPRLQRDVARP